MKFGLRCNKISAIDMSDRNLITINKVDTQEEACYCCNEVVAHEFWVEMSGCD